MAKKNADRMFERFSPVSGEVSTGRTAVLKQTGGAAMLNLSFINDVVAEL